MVSHHYDRLSVTGNLNRSKDNAVAYYIASIQGFNLNPIKPQPHPVALIGNRIGMAVEIINSLFCKIFLLRPRNDMDRYISLKYRR